MILTHDNLVLLAKTLGLAWLMGFFLLAVVFAYRPSRRAFYERAANSVLRQDDRPPEARP